MIRIRKVTFAVLFLLPLAFSESLGKTIGLEVQRSTSRRLTVLPYYYPPGGCHPVEVKAVVVGSREALTPQVTVVSFSAKPITAVKLSWNVYQWETGRKRARSNCATQLDPAEIFLNGTTPLIQVGSLVQHETCNISLNPLVVQFPASRTVFVEHPIITWDELKPLTVDGMQGNYKDDYAAVVFVSDVEFADGTTWEGTIE